jgi:hypothetical protein
MLVVQVWGVPSNGQLLYTSTAFGVFFGVEGVWARVCRLERTVRGDFLSFWV